MRTIQELFQRFLDKKCSPEEISILLEYFQAGEKEQVLDELIRQELSRDLPEARDTPRISAILERNRRVLMETAARDRRFRPSKSKLSKTFWYAAAASLIGISSLLGFYLHHRPSGLTGKGSQTVMYDAVPGSDRAMLTLSDGRILALDSTGDGKLAQEVGVTLLKADGALRYRMEDDLPAQATMQYNMVSVPRGGEYQVVLPDGTRVWLNAESSLKFPVRFSRTSREVELIGEGYFEVAHRAEQPFVVKSSGQEVIVLGTHFNIKAYQNETHVQTTLVEGSVRVHQAGTGKQRVLRPGQQARVNDRSFDVVEASLEEAIAWKNKQFVFRNTDIHTVMKQLERWYDVELAATELPDKRFYGEISRNVKLSELFEMIELTSGLKFKLEGRKIMLE